MGYKRKGIAGGKPHPKRLQRDTTLDASTGKRRIPLCQGGKQRSNGVNGRSDIRGTAF